MDLPGWAGGERLLAASRPVERTEEDVEQGGDRHPEERTEDAAQLGADQQRRHGDQGMNAGGGSGDPRPQDVRLDGVATNRRHQGEQRNEGAFEDERDQHRQTHPDWGADQRQEFQEERQYSKDDRVGDADQCHHQPGVGPHDKRHDQLASRVLPHRGANGEQREVVDLFASRKDFAQAGDQLAALHQEVDRDHDHQQHADQRS